MNVNKRVLNSKDVEDTPQICKEFGYDKKLTPMEKLYSDYCFTHAAAINQRERAKAKLFSGHTYKAVLFRWNSQYNLWEQQREILLTHEQCFAKHESSDFDNSEKLFYRYDLFCDYQCIDIVYKYSPTYFDI